LNVSLDGRLDDSETKFERLLNHKSLLNDVLVAGFFHLNLDAILFEVGVDIDGVCASSLH
jgi:hypothetical protein